MMARTLPGPDNIHIRRIFHLLIEVTRVTRRRLEHLFTSAEFGEETRRKRGCEGEKRKLCAGHGVEEREGVDGARLGGGAQDG